MTYRPVQCPVLTKAGNRCDLWSIEGTYYSCEAGHNWWRPNEGAQTAFLRSRVHELLYGGAAGGGKSIALTMMPLRWIDNPHFNGILFRRETGHLAELKRYCREYFGGADPGAYERAKGEMVTWRFSSGAVLRLAHCKDEDDALAYNGQELPWIGIDELTHFTWKQYRELKSRCRSTKPGLPTYIRATTNPGGPGHAWVFRRWGAWFDPKFTTECGEGVFMVNKQRVHTKYGLDKRDGLPPLASGQVAYILRPDKDEKEYFVPKGTPGALSRSFIQALLKDNPVLCATNPNYRAILADNDQVRREQLENGNWTIVAAAGMYFKREWFRLYCYDPQCMTCLSRNIESPGAVTFKVPSGYQARYWDRAATPEPVGASGDDPDWTVGMRGTYDGNDCYIDDIERFREGPGGVEKRIVEAARLDGVEVAQALEQDPGSAGKFEVSYYFKALAGYQIIPVLPRGGQSTDNRDTKSGKQSKMTRAKPVSSQCQGGHIYLWAHMQGIEELISEAEAFPEETAHDDQIDALSGLYFILHRTGGGGSATDSSVSSNPDTHAVNQGSFA